MSQSQLADTRAVGKEASAVTEEDEIDTVLEALEDADCRAILAATSDEALTVNELLDACDVAQSTAYRKVEALVDAGLLEEDLRLRASGSHVSTYRCRLEDVTLSVDGESGVELSLTRTASDDPFSTPVARY